MSNFQLLYSSLVIAERCIYKVIQGFNPRNLSGKAKHTMAIIKVTPSVNAYLCKLTQQTKLVFVQKFQIFLQAAN